MCRKAKNYRSSRQFSDAESRRAHLYTLTSMCVLRKGNAFENHFKSSLRIASGEGVPFRHKRLTHKNVKKNRSYRHGKNVRNA